MPELSFNSSTRTVIEKNTTGVVLLGDHTSNDAVCDDRHFSPCDMLAKLPSLEKKEHKKPKKYPTKTRSNLPRVSPRQSHNNTNAGGGDGKVHYKKESVRIRSQQRTNDPQINTVGSQEEDGYQLDGDYEEGPVNDESKERRIKKVSSKVAKSTANVERRAPLKAKEIKSKRKSKKNKKEVGSEEQLDYFELELKHAILETPLSPMSMDDDWFEEMHEELNGNDLDGLDRSSSLLEDDKTPGRPNVIVLTDKDIISTPTLANGEDELLSALEPARIAVAYELFKTSQSKCDSRIRVAKKKFSGVGIALAAQMEKRTPSPAYVNRVKASIREEVESDYGNDDPYSPDSVSSIAVAVADLDQMKKANPNTLKSYIASPEWQGHKKVLDDWRVFVEDKRGGFSRERHRSGLTSQMSERNFLTKARREALKRPALPRRTSTGMMLEQPSAERDDDSLSVDTWEAEEQKKVLGCSLALAKRNS